MPSRRHFLLGSGATGLSTFGALPGLAAQSGAGASGATGRGLFTFDDNTAYGMPPFFGGYSGEPRSSFYADQSVITFSYETDGAMLRKYLPQVFSLREPRLNVSIINNRGVDWMAGRPYNIMSVNVPVRFEGEEDQLDGELSLVVWENHTTPILAGRETAGIPKVFAEIPDMRDVAPGVTRSWLSFEGVKFFQASFTAVEVLKGGKLEARTKPFESLNWFGWRHIPNVGGPGAALSEAVLFPQEFQFKSATDGTVEFDWTPLEWAQNPTQAHIIAALAALPKPAGPVPATFARTSNILRSDISRVLR